jgi:hypothetical protein
VQKSVKKKNPLVYVNPVVAALLLAQFITLPVMKFTGLSIASEAHEAIGLLFGASILVHLYFNRVWIINNFFPGKKSK